MPNAVLVNEQKMQHDSLDVEGREINPTLGVFHTKFNLFLPWNSDRWQFNRPGILRPYKNRRC